MPAISIAGFFLFTVERKKQQLNLRELHLLPEA